MSSTSTRDSNPRSPRSWLSPCHLPVCLLVAAALVVTVVPGLAVEVTIGPEDQTVRERVETPNLAPGEGGFQPSAVAPTPLPGQNPGPAPTGEALHDKVRRVWTHLLQPAGERRSGRPTAGSLDQVVTGEAAGPGLEVTGVGVKVGVAEADGPVAIEIYMPTFEPAGMEVHLFEATGEEVLFAGRPLLSWVRLDDKAFAPVFFEGKADPASVYENKPGDFSPSADLSYRFAIKRGQRLQIETNGRPLPESFLRVTGPVR